MSNTQTTIGIPSGLSESNKETLARNMVDEIKKRSRSGIDRYGVGFKPYSKEYKAVSGKSKVDLTETGDMLSELDVISIDDDSITIGYKSGHELEGQVEGNQIGSYGRSPNADKARKFIGLPSKTVDLLVAELPVEEDKTVEEEVTEIEIKEKRTDAIIGSIFGRMFTSVD